MPFSLDDALDGLYDLKIDLEDIRHVVSDLRSQNMQWLADMHAQFLALSSTRVPNTPLDVHQAEPIAEEIGSNTIWDPPQGAADDPTVPPQPTADAVAHTIDDHESIREEPADSAPEPDELPLPPVPIEDEPLPPAAPAPAPPLTNAARAPVRPMTQPTFLVSRSSQRTALVLDATVAAAATQSSITKEHGSVSLIVAPTTSTAENKKPSPTSMPTPETRPPAVPRPGWMDALGLRERDVVQPLDTTGSQSADANTASDALLREAAFALTQLNQSSVSEFRAFRSPPLGVRLVAEAVALLASTSKVSAKSKVPVTPSLQSRLNSVASASLAHASSWDAIRSLFGDPALPIYLRSIDFASVPVETIATLRTRFIDNPDFTPAAVSAVSVTAANLCMWCHAAFRFVKLNKIAEFKRRLASGETLEAVNSTASSSSTDVVGAVENATAESHLAHPSEGNKRAPTLTTTTANHTAVAVSVTTVGASTRGGEEVGEYRRHAWALPAVVLQGTHLGGRTVSPPRAPPSAPATDQVHAGSHKAPLPHELIAMRRAASPLRSSSPLAVTAVSSYAAATTSSGSPSGPKWEPVRDQFVVSARGGALGVATSSGAGYQTPRTYHRVKLGSMSRAARDGTIADLAPSELRAGPRLGGEAAHAVFRNGRSAKISQPPKLQVVIAPIS